MSKKGHNLVAVIPDSHAHPKFKNDRALWLGNYLYETKPDLVIHLGDSADMDSLNSYDRNNRRAFQGKSYRDDINSHLDFMEKLWHKYKKNKKRIPKRVFLEGNHEHRIEKALDVSPELVGTISFDDLMLDDFFDEVYRYEGSTPAIYEDNGIFYSHYLVSGLMGKPISGEHHAASLLGKKFVSCTVGHSHTLDYSVRTKADGKKIMGLVCGCYQDYTPAWAGNSGKLWHSGIITKRNVLDGTYDLETISIDRLKKEYSK